MVRFSDVLLEKEPHSDSLIHLWNDHLRVFKTDLTLISLLQLLPTVRRVCLSVLSWSVTFDIIKAPGNRKQEAAWRPLTMLVTFFFFFWSFTWVRLSNSTQTEQRPSAARTETDGRNILTSVFRVSRFHRGRSEVKPINNRNLWPGNEGWLNPLPVKTKTDVRGVQCEINNRFTSDWQTPHNKVEADFCCVVVLDPGSYFSLSKQAAAVLNCILHSRSKTATN